MTEPLRVLSLFSGIGMIDLGLQRAGMTIVGQCEIEPFCNAVLAKHWPNVERHNDVRTLDGSLWRSRADIICGGFPCQDISVAGKQRGIGEGTRSGLWFEMRRIIAGCRPTWVLAENVPALRTLGADLVLADLGELGYACVPLVVGAWAVGAPHKRDRVWIVGRRSVSDYHDPAGTKKLIPLGPFTEEAESRRSGERHRVGHDDRISIPTIGSFSKGKDCEPVRYSELADSQSRGLGELRTTSEPTTADLDECDEELSDAEGSRPQAEREQSIGAQTEHTGTARDGHRWPAGPRSPQHEWEQPHLIEFTLGSPTDGDAFRLVRLAKRHNREALRAYGNGAVPQVVEAIGRAIIAAHGQGRQP